MKYMSISGDNYSSDELADFVAECLNGIGLNAFRYIKFNSNLRKICIAFDKKKDANIARAIDRSVIAPNTKKFKSRNAKQFLIALHTVSNQQGIC